MRMKFGLLLAVLLTGCTQTVELKTPFNPSEHSFAAKQGQARLTGQAFMRRNDGVVVYAAGSRVFLMPDTPYTREIFASASTAVFALDVKNMDMRLKQYIKHTQADGEGRFSFNEVPDGKYLIVTNVFWKAGDSRQGGDLTLFKTVSGGRDENVILTR